jgi:hypothetical protein
VPNLRPHEDTGAKIYFLSERINEIDLA